MEYERIHKVQMGVMSPTKLRMKLLGSHGSSSKTDEAKKSPRALPARLDTDEDDDDHPKNSLLPPELDEEYPKDRSDSSRSRSDASHGRAGHGGGGGNGYDSGHDACGGGFEFYREERPPPAAAAVVGGPFFRQVPSKWNDAEKWLTGRHVVHSNPIFSNKTAAAAAAVSGHTGGGRVAPDASSDVRKSAGCSVGSALTELSSSPPSSSSSMSRPAIRQPHHKRLRVSEPALAAVSMRDVGTEMTPMESKEQSRSGTPAGAATPSLSPLCSVPSSPRGGGSASASATASSSSSSERELQIRTRREIAALGLQLGKMSIASWASKEEEELPRASPEKRPRPHSGDDDAKTREFEARAVAWQETQRCKLALRFQRKEVKIQEWESCQKTKFEAKMRHAEVQAEQMKARAKQKLSRRLSALSHKAEGKQARVEARRSRQAARLARQVDRIREIGAAPSRLRRRCNWLFL